MPHIAIVDDEEPVRKALGRLLEASGLEVACYAGGRDFLDECMRRRFDCVVLDLHMPGMSGLQVLAELRRRRPPIPAIVVTAHNAAETRAQCFAAGAAEFLRKPLDERVLRDAISACLHSPRLTENHS
ncbi:MAG TPA: response regulator [Burkholderiales bacterium]|nr:response regulator [Burkholderiales bacterium]